MFPSIDRKVKLSALPPQMLAEAALLMAETGRSPDVVCRAVGISPEKARSLLTAGPFRRSDDFNMHAGAVD